MAKQRKKTKKEKRQRQEKRRQRRREREEREKRQFDLDCDETFAFIAGYTSNGVPYGITHEEMKEIELKEKLDFGFEFFQLEFDDDCDDSFFEDDDFEDDDEEKHYEDILVRLSLSEKALAEQLLVEQQNSPIKWSNDHWYDPDFDWENYFGVKGKEKTREELVYHLNLYDLIKVLERANRKNNHQQQINLNEDDSDLPF